MRPSRCQQHCTGTRQAPPAPQGLGGAGRSNLSGAPSTPKMSVASQPLLSSVTFPILLPALSAPLPPHSFRKKCLVLAVIETDGRTKATALLGRVVINLAEYAGESTEIPPAPSLSHSSPLPRNSYPLQLMRRPSAVIDPRPSFRLRRGGVPVFPSGLQPRHHCGRGAAKLTARPGLPLEK